MEKQKKTKQKYLDSSRKWKKENKERIKKTDKIWRDDNKDKTEESRDKSRFGGNVQEVLERDNFQCQNCEMSQEQHIIIFGTRLDIHHLDGKGRNARIKNNDINNLICLCHICHRKVHSKIIMTKRWGGLLEQDDSEYLYPEIRKIIQSKKEKLGTLEKAKQELADELGVAFFNIDHKYYDRKYAKRSKNE